MAPAGVTCSDVRDPGIILTLEGLLSNVDSAMNHISENGLNLPSFNFR